MLRVLGNVYLVFQIIRCFLFTSRTCVNNSFNVVNCDTGMSMDFFLLKKYVPLVKLFLTICDFFEMTSILSFSTAVNRTRLFSRVIIRVMLAGLGKN